MARFVAVLPAGGASRRVADHSAIKTFKSKLLVPISGKPVLVRTLEVFRSLGFEYLVIPVPADLQSEFLPLQELFPDLNLRFVVGGESRQQSVFNALKYIYSAERSREDLYVLVHDAARCFVSPEILRAAQDEVLTHQAVAAAIPISDTVVEVTKENLFQKTLDREVLRSVQTPQAFKFDLLYHAHQYARGEQGQNLKYPDSFDPETGVEILAVRVPPPAPMPNPRLLAMTDDASLVAEISKVYYFAGSSLNKKITYAEDLNIR